MLYISPLPFLLALGMEKCLSIAKQPITPQISKSILPRFVPLLSMAPFVALSAGLFLIWDSNVRLILVVAALIVALVLVAALPKYRTLDALIVTVLALLLFNAAFRTLFPLVLDPHNIFTLLGGR
jgi:hypothetical protein